MAESDIDPIWQRPVLQDGVALCRVCATSAPDAGHDWCPAVASLVCEDCCHRILLGAIGQHIAATVSGQTPPGPSMCAGCERGRAWMTGQVLGALTTGERAN